jgi:four helix bundle protein
MENKTESPLLNKSFSFAIEIIHLYEYIRDYHKEYVLSKQILKSGTSVGAMVREAQNAESLMDFIHKLSIAQKEADETIYWLELLRETSFIEPEHFTVLHPKAVELLRLLKSSILTCKQRNARKQQSHN